MNVGLVVAVEIIVAATWVASNNAIEEAIEPLPDFANISVAPSFVDRTMLIKTLFGMKERILVSAPHRSGKSTVLDMLRRFLEIEVDEAGMAKERNSSSNYKLFKSLNIGRCEQFLDEHFGKYPVIVIQCKPLGKVNRFYGVLQHFRDVTRDIYTRHKYLLQHKHLWLDEVEIEHFNDFVLKTRKHKQNPSFHYKALPYLCEILYMHFGKRVIVLVDDYDAFLDSPDLKLSPDVDLIIEFLRKFHTALLRSSRYVERALLTGFYRKSYVQLPVYSYPVLPINTVAYSYLDDRPLCKYFSVTF